MYWESEEEIHVEVVKDRVKGLLRNGVKRRGKSRGGGSRCREKFEGSYADIRELDKVEVWGSQGGRETAGFYTSHHDRNTRLGTNLNEMGPVVDGGLPQKEISPKIR